MATLTLSPEDVTAVIDTREQRPLDVAPLKMVTGTLATGDYSVLGLERDVAVERKSLPDLLGCIGRERERFERELERLQAYRTRAVVVEASWAMIKFGGWRSQLSPRQVEASINAWTARYAIPFVLAGTREAAAEVVRDLLFFAARDAWRTLQAFHPTLKIVSSSGPSVAAASGG